MEGQPIGVAYCSPEPVTAGIWNLRLLWIKEEFRGRGYGKALVAKVENELSTRHARLLIVETSQLPEFESARKFYENYGFKREAEVKDFFDEGDHKLIYTKRVNVS